LGLRDFIAARSFWCTLKSISKVEWRRMHIKCNQLNEGCIQKWNISTNPISVQGNSFVIGPIGCFFISSKTNAPYSSANAICWKCRIQPIFTTEVLGRASSDGSIITLGKLLI
jgi:hypothetical protein